MDIQKIINIKMTNRHLFFAIKVTFKDTFDIFIKYIW